MSLEEFSFAYNQKEYRDYFDIAKSDRFLSKDDLCDELKEDFLECLLSFCLGIQNILYTRLVEFLVKELFNQVRLLQEEDLQAKGIEISDDEGNTQESDQDGSDQEDVTPQVITKGHKIKGILQNNKSKVEETKDAQSSSSDSEEEFPSTTSQSKGHRCFSALLKLSMSKESHDEITDKKNATMIALYLEKLSIYIRKIPSVWHQKIITDTKMDKSELHEVTKLEQTQIIEHNESKQFLASKFQKYINILTVISNCLTSKAVCMRLLEKNFKFLRYLVTKFHYFIDQLGALQEELGLDSDDSSASSVTPPLPLQQVVAAQMQSLINDCTLSLCLLETLDATLNMRPEQRKLMTSIKSEDSDQQKAEYLLTLLEDADSSIHIVYKALFCLAQLSDKWTIVKYLYSKDIVDILEQLCERDEPQLIRVISYLITHMIQKPEELRLWLKFDAANPAVNSGGMTNTVRQFGKPGRMPPNRGIYRNWGAFFDFNDCLMISGGLEMVKSEDNNFQWSITFWTLLPFAYDTKQKRILIQDVTGRGAYFLFDEKGSRMGSIDERSGEFIDAGIDLANNKKIKHGWHHIAVVCQADEHHNQYISYFLDGVKTKGKEAGGSHQKGKDESKSKPQKIHLTNPIGFVGNSEQGNSPFQVVADLRIYPYPLTKNYIMKQSKYDPALESQMPDKYLDLFINKQIPQFLVLKIAQESATTNTTILRMLTWFASKREGRACLLSHNIYDVILPLQKHQNPILRLSVQKLITNLL